MVQKLKFECGHCGLQGDVTKFYKKCENCGTEVIHTAYGLPMDVKE